MSKKAKQLAPVDTDVKIPAAVTAAADKAAALHQEAYAAPAEATPAPAPAAEPAPAAAAPAEATPAAEPAPAPAAATPEPAPAPVVTTKGNDTWEHKYLSLKGRFDRSETVTRALKDQIAGLETVIASMSVSAPAAPASSPSAITAAEREAFGDDFINLASKVAAEKFAPEVTELKATVKNLTERLESTATKIGQSDRDRMHADLTTAVPNWLEVNEQDAFKDWLALPAPYSSAIKLDLLRAAYAANDTPRVLAFFQGFLAEEAAKVPQPEPVPTPPAPLAAPKVPLEQFAAPGRAKTAAAPPAPVEKPIFTRAQVSQFYVDVAAKKWVGREDEKARMDKAIVDAGREGRIR